MRIAKQNKEYLSIFCSNLIDALTTPSSADKFGAEIRLNTEFISRRSIRLVCQHNLSSRLSDFLYFEMGNVGFFGEFKNFKMAAISCYVPFFSGARVLLWQLAIALVYYIVWRVNLTKSSLTSSEHEGQQ